MPFTSNRARGGWERYDIQMYPLKGQDLMRDQMWQDIADMADGKKGIDGLKHVKPKGPRLSWLLSGPTVIIMITP